jgi:hypothetical protein
MRVIEFATDVPRAWKLVFTVWVVACWNEMITECPADVVSAQKVENVLLPLIRTFGL